MKLNKLIFLIFGTVIIFFGCQDDSTLAPVAYQSDDIPDFLAKKPAPHLTGNMELFFNLAVFGNPSEPPWVGTITFEGDEDIYNMKFYSLLPPREFSQARPFEENFEIYKLIDGEKIICLEGHDKGVTTLANKPPDDTKYRMNGEIDVANPPFSEWLGRNVHMSGVITWQVLDTPDGQVVAPKTAPGIFRIN